tara:strand:- start:328 stop:888 length:561 start_codon:yes stop_codon:yes gene_type:complete
MGESRVIGVMLYETGTNLSWQVADKYWPQGGVEELARLEGGGLLAEGPGTCLIASQSRDSLVVVPFFRFWYDSFKGNGSIDSKLGDWEQGDLAWNQEYPFIWSQDLSIDKVALKLMGEVGKFSGEGNLMVVYSGPHDLLELRREMEKYVVNTGLFGKPRLVNGALKPRERVPLVTTVGIAYENLRV